MPAFDFRLISPTVHLFSATVRLFQVSGGKKPPYICCMNQKHNDMDTSNLNPEEQHSYISWQKSHRRGKVIGGIFIVTFGVLFLLREANVPMPDWIFKWEMIITAVGIITLIKHKFRKLFGWVLIGVGQLFLFHDFYPDLINIKFIWPVLVILCGLAMIFRSHKNKHHYHRKDHHRKWEKMRTRHAHMFRDLENLDAISDEDFIDSVSFFSGIKKNVVSKNFKGADIVTIFGGSEINLLQADFEEKAVIDVTTVFGGMTLTIPSNWKVKSELTAFFGGIEDKRVMETNTDEPEKTLILRGACVFGGIELNNF